MRYGRTSPSISGRRGYMTTNVDKSTSYSESSTADDLKERRRAEILEAATELFAESDYRNADVQVLADRLGVGKGTVYRYFPSKEELFFAAVDHGLRQLLAAVEEAVSQETSDIDRAKVGIRTYLRFFDENPRVTELLIQERANFRTREKSTYFVHREANIGRWNDVFRAMIARGEVRDLPPERITDVISNLLYGTMFTNYFAGRVRPLSEQCEDILDVLFHGLLRAPQQGQ
jgi:AcrR family transcriptional regulator